MKYSRKAVYTGLSRDVNVVSRLRFSNVLAS